MRKHPSNNYFKIFFLILLFPLSSSASEFNKELDHLLLTCASPKEAGKLSRVICKGLEYHLARKDISSSQRVPLKSKRIDKMGEIVYYGVSSRPFTGYAKRKSLTIYKKDSLKSRKKKVSQYLHYVGTRFKKGGGGHPSLFIDANVEVIEGKSFSLSIKVFKKKNVD